METLPNTAKYLLDTSALVEFEDFFNPNNWQPVWDFLFELGKRGKIVIIDDVYLELDRRFSDYKITKWVNDNKDKLHVIYTLEHFSYLSDEVLVKCNIIDEHHTNPVYADPMLLAVAGCDGYILVTRENKAHGLQPNTRPEKIKIPNHCDTLGIKDYIHGNHVWKNLLEKEGFSLKKH